MPPIEHVEKRYEHLEDLREPYLLRARACAEITIPMLIPQKGHNSTQEFISPWQSLGARGVNNLASKLMLALLPPSNPFFRFRIAEKELEQAFIDSNGTVTRASVEEALAQQETIVLNDMETSFLRPSTFEMLKHLIVSGNVLIFLPEKGAMRVFPLDQYVVKRDPSGDVLEIITKEEIGVVTLSEEVRKLLNNADEPFDTGTKSKDHVDIYTYVRLEGDRWKTHQEIEGHTVPDSEGDYPKGESPWLALRFERIDNEDYGRGLVEQYYGDLNSVEGLRKSLVHAAQASARLLFLVAPNSSTSTADLNNAPNGAFVTGRAEDIQPLQVNKFADLRVAREMQNEIKADLAHVFLLHSAVQRNAERVTAEEVRMMAQELNSALGGTYSILSQEFQIPLVKLFVNRLSKRNQIMPFLHKQMKKGVINLDIVTGVEALGRESDVTKLTSALGLLGQFGIDHLLKEINTDEVVKRVFANQGVDHKGLLKTEEQKNQMQAQQQKAQEEAKMFEILKSATPEMAKQIIPQLLPQGQEQQPQQP